MYKFYLKASLSKELFPDLENFKLLYSELEMHESPSVIEDKASNKTKWKHFLEVSSDTKILKRQ